MYKVTIKFSLFLTTRIHKINTYFLVHFETKFGKKCLLLEYLCQALSFVVYCSCTKYFSSLSATIYKRLLYMF